ncbi:MAG: indolepyruvate ferredoxin oxidoreductase subunit alpha, partial [Anaerovoracaceae bacterium]
GTPSTEITENVSKFYDIDAEWAPNEKVGLEVAVGASIAGVRALSCMKHVGLNVAADPFFTAAYTGVNAGLVIIVADDNGCHSSQNEQDSRYYARSGGVPMLEPADSQECKDYMLLAYELSEKYDTPILIRSNTRISHSRGVVTLGEEQKVDRVPYKKNMMKYVAMPAMARKLHVEQEKRLKAFSEDSNSFEINAAEYLDKKIGIITSGICYQYVKEALPEVSVLKLGTVNPLPKNIIKDFSCEVEKLYIIEEGEAIIEEQIKAMGIACWGKDMFSIQGEYSVNLIKKAFGKKVDEYLEEREMPNRPPLMCAGCPHRAVFHLLRKLGKVVTGDIGCYTLGALPPTAAMDTCLCMGASISMAHGFEKAGGKDFGKRVVAVIGDSTFFHSGITGLINMKYNKVSGTVMILDNRITGMTGHQDNPSTGRDIKGEPAPALSIEELVKACGADSIRVVDPFEMGELEKIIKEESEADRLSVIIAKRPCALILKSTGDYYQINDNCKKCKKCMEIGCPAIENQNGEIVIIKERCNACDLCSRVCPFSAIEKVEK